MDKIERMKTEYLKNLLEKYKTDTKDLDLINKIAIWYTQNVEMCQNSEDEFFFRRAYNVKKTIKSTHNLACYLFCEYWDSKEIERIQKECIELNPKSIYPYLLYWEVLMRNKKYKEAACWHLKK